MALELEEPPALLVEDTWSAGRDSGTGCNVGVLIVLEAVVVVKTGPEDMSSLKRHVKSAMCRYFLTQFM